LAECIESVSLISAENEERRLQVLFRESPAVIERSCRFHQSSERVWVEWTDGRKCPFARCLP